MHKSETDERILKIFFVKSIQDTTRSKECFMFPFYSWFGANILAAFLWILTQVLTKDAQVSRTRMNGLSSKISHP